MGELLSAGSAALNRIPEGLDFFTRKPVESSVQVRWRHLNKHPDEIDQEWVHHDGVGAGVLPRNFKYAQILLVDKDVLASNLDLRPGRIAVTYRLGSTVMMGSSERMELIYGSASVSAPDYQIAMGLGNGALDAGVGIHLAPDVYHGFTTGLRAGEVVPIQELPPYTPLV